MTVFCKLPLLAAALVGCVLGSACSSTQPNTLTEQELEEGWQLLFDGESFAGWSEYNGNPAETAWQIDHGTMMVLPGFKEKAHDIVTDESFENFELSLEWKVSPGANSGIFYLVRKLPEYGEAWKTSPEMQVLDNELHSNGKEPTHRAADLYGLIEADSAVTNEVGEWNHVRIVVDHGKVEHWLNGRLVVSYELWTEEWDELIAGSKFAELKDFAQEPGGHISLQEHEDRVWYRNVKIKRLQ